MLYLLLAWPAAAIGLAWLLAGTVRLRETYRR